MEVQHLPRDWRSSSRLQENVRRASRLGSLIPSQQESRNHQVKIGLHLRFEELSHPPTFRCNKSNIANDSSPCPTFHLHRLQDGERNLLRCPQLHLHLATNHLLTPKPPNSHRKRRNGFDSSATASARNAREVLSRHKRQICHQSIYGKSSRT